MASGPATPARGGEIPDGLFYGIVGAIPVLVGISWTVAQAAALTATQQTAGVGLAESARAVPRLAFNASEPAVAYGEANNVPGPLAYWATTVIVATVVVVTVVAAIVLVTKRRGRPGMANRRDLEALRSRQVTARAGGLRPDLPATAPKEERLHAAGLALGRQWPNGPQLYGTVEDSYLVIAPPRTGKTVRAVIPTVLDHPGPAVVTSTRWDVLRITGPARARQGPVWVFDADQRNITDLPAGTQPACWSPVNGAHDPQTAMVRARSLARSSGAGEGIQAGDFFLTHAERVLRCYLHAAALDGRSIADVRSWADDPDDRNPLKILQGSTTAPAWAGELSSLARVSDRQRDGVWGVVQQALAALADPRLLDTLTPTAGAGFVPDELITAAGTLYIVGQAETQDVIAPLVAALVEAVADSARQHAVTQPAGRLAPNLLLALDEVANIAPLPTLPTLLADGGGTGITTMVVLQSRSQAHARWGEDAAEAIIAACTHRLILGGGGELRELEDLSRLIGERDDEVRSHSWQPGGGHQGGGSSTQTSLRRIPIITPADLQAMEKGRGVLTSPATRPVEIRLPAWWERPDAGQLDQPTNPAPISDQRTGASLGEGDNNE